MAWSISCEVLAYATVGCWHCCQTLHGEKMEYIKSWSVLTFFISRIYYISWNDDSSPSYDLAATLPPLGFMYHWIKATGSRPCWSSCHHAGQGSNNISYPRGWSYIMLRKHSIVGVIVVFFSFNLAYTIDRYFYFSFEPENRRNVRLNPISGR